MSRTEDGDNDDAQSRRTFLKDTATAAAAVLAGGYDNESPGQPDPPSSPKAESKSIKPGDMKMNGHFGVCYGQRLNASDFQGFDMVMVEPAWYPDKAPSPRAMAYVSIAAVNKSNKKLIGAIDAQKGWLRDNSERIVRDPIGNSPETQMCDVRNPKVQAVFKDHIKTLMQQGYGGVFIDTLDSASKIEQDGPPKFKGLREAELNLIADVAKDLHADHKKIIVNGGLYDGGRIQGDDPLKFLPQHVDGIACESQATNGGEFRGMHNDARPWTTARLKTAGLAERSADRAPLAIYPIEPQAPRSGSKEKLAEQAEAYWSDLRKDLEGAGCRLNIQTPYCAQSAPGAEFKGLNRLQVDRPRSR